jgi:hypothetical protein
MTRCCRTLYVRRQSLQSASAVLRHARIVTDPKQLAELYAEAARRKQFTTAECKGARKYHNS